MNKVEGLAGAIYATVTGTGEEVFHALPENRKDRWLLDAKRVSEWLAAYDATPSQRLDAATVERLVLDMDFANTPPIDWTAHDWSRLAAALATEPHQHGGKGA